MARLSEWGVSPYRIFYPWARWDLGLAHLPTCCCSSLRSVRIFIFLLSFWVRVSPEWLGAYLQYWFIDSTYLYINMCIWGWLFDPGGNIGRSRKIVNHIMHIFIRILRMFTIFAYRIYMLMYRINIFMNMLRIFIILVYRIYILMYRINTIMNISRIFTILVYRINIFMYRITIFM